MSGHEHADQVARVRASELLADTPEERHGIYPNRHLPPRRYVVVALPAGCQLSEDAWKAAASITTDTAGYVQALFTPAALVALGLVQLRHGDRERRAGPREPSPVDAGCDVEPCAWCGLTRGVEWVHPDGSPGPFCQCKDRDACRARVERRS